MVCSSWMDGMSLTGAGASLSADGSQAVGRSLPLEAPLQLAVPAPGCRRRGWRLLVFLSPSGCLLVLHAGAVGSGSLPPPGQQGWPWAAVSLWALLCSGQAASSVSQSLPLRPGGQLVDRGTRIWTLQYTLCTALAYRPRGWEEKTMMTARPMELSCRVSCPQAQTGTGHGGSPGVWGVAQRAPA